MSAHNSIVATYANRSVAEAAVTKLHDAGFDMSKLYTAVRDSRKLAGKADGATAIGEIGVLDETLYRIGIPKESVLDYEAEFKIDRLLLAAHGTSDEITLAKNIIETTHPDGWNGKVGCAVYYGCFD
ncbi:MAG: hypothetical protein WC091_18250 [Sulfuricellaceae bacterium]